MLGTVEVDSKEAEARELQRDATLNASGVRREKYTHDN